MKRINPPIIRDESILDDLSQNTLLTATSYPHLQRQLQVMKDNYHHYQISNGNAWHINNPSITDELKIALVKHYESPPEQVNFLDRLRSSSPDVCPMCGGFHPTTLDHILPKGDYPTWSIYSLNLVPACGCNMSRGNALKGNPATLSRVLHPYFDDIMSERLLSSVITTAPDFRWLKAEIDYINPQHADIGSIRYHTRSIIVKAGIDLWFRGQLNRLKQKPMNIIKSLPRRRRIQLDEVDGFMEDCLEGYDEQCDTPNNWNSILIHGLKRAVHTHQWIVQRHNRLVP
jgi:hypothetical protein